MRPGKGREDQLAAPRVARMHRQLVAMFGDPDQGVHVGHIQFGVDALREQVHAKRYQIDIAGALPIAEQRALDPVGPGHDAKFGGGHPGAAVVVRMQAQDHAVAVFDGAAEPFDLVGIDIRRRHLDRGRQVENDRIVRRRFINIHHRLADLDGIVEFGPGETFR